MTIHKKEKVYGGVNLFCFSISMKRMCFSLVKNMHLIIQLYHTCDSIFVLLVPSKLLLYRVTLNERWKGGRSIAVEFSRNPVLTHYSLWVWRLFAQEDGSNLPLCWSLSSDICILTPASAPSWPKAPNCSSAGFIHCTTQWVWAQIKC